MENKASDWRRHALGLLGLGCLLAYIVLLIASDATSGRQQMFASICLRLGIVLCATWLAFDQVHKLGRAMPRWAWIFTGLALLLFVASPKLFPLSFGLLAIVGLRQFIAWLKTPPE